MKQSKPYWEMTTAELRTATLKFDPAYQPPALPKTAEDIAQQRRAKNKGAKPVGDLDPDHPTNGGVGDRTPTRCGLASGVPNLCSAD
jgi:hypothetical protein